jgi:hypothetical protein
VPEQILDFFPVQDVATVPFNKPHIEKVDLLKRVQETLVPQGAVSKKNEEKGIHRPGEFYKRDRDPEELTDNIKAFLTLAGNYANPPNN